MRVLVLSHRHALLPYAHRLTREGASVDVVVWQHDYERAWDGQLAKVLRGSKGELTQERLVELAKDSVVVTDVPGARSYFPEGQRVFDTLAVGAAPTSQLRLGAWMGPEQWQLRHVVIADVGALSGGLGANIAGSATLIRIDNPKTIELFDSISDQVRQQLKSASFQGLVSMGLDLAGVDGASIIGVEAGWPWLHSQCFISELETLSGLLEGRDTNLVSKFVCCTPVSIPPWPSIGQSKVIPVEGLTSQAQAKTFWHDISIDPAARKLTTAGLDGLIGVARGAADTLDLARGRSLEIALRMQVYERQFRTDCGSTVSTVLAELEDRFGITL